VAGKRREAESDQSRHVGEETVEPGRPARTSNVKKEIRNLSALVDEELTTLEGAE
jgi:hypothetical protein